MTKKLYALGLIIPLVFIGYDEEDGNVECDLTTHGTIVDYTGVDGCGVLVQNDIETFEVLNWAEINFMPEDGMEICFDYNVEYDWPSICMKGSMITITDCQVLE